MYPRALFLPPACAGLEASVTRNLRAAHSRFARAGRVAARRPALPNSGAVSDRSWCGGGGPEEAGEFAGARDDSDVVRLAAGAHPVIEAVQAMLASVRDLKDVLGLAVLAALERGADPGLAGGRGTTSARCPCGSFSDAALPNPA